MDDGERSDASKSGTQTSFSYTTLSMADTSHRTDALVGRQLEDLTSSSRMSRDDSEYRVVDDVESLKYMLEGGKTNARCPSQSVWPRQY